MKNPTSSQPTTDRLENAVLTIGFVLMIASIIAAIGLLIYTSPR